MSAPTDNTYSAARDWARNKKAQENKNAGRQDMTYWIIFGVVILILIGIYIWYLRVTRPKPEMGAIAALNPNGKHPPMYLDNRGKVQVE